MSVGKKILMLFNINDPENRIDLTFQHRYGNIVSYRWYYTLKHMVTPCDQAEILSGEQYLVYNDFSFSLCHIQVW